MTIAQPTPYLELFSSANPSAVGDDVTFRALVQSSQGATPTGIVTLYDGQTVLATLTLNAYGSVSFTTASLTAGQHDITAAYSGDANYAPYITTLVQTVDDSYQSSQTNTNLTASSNPSPVGQPVTFTAAVEAYGSPTGTVSFYDGGTLIGTGAVVNGVATFTTSGLSSGGHTITAVYGGDANFSGSTSQELWETIE